MTGLYIYAIQPEPFSLVNIPKSVSCIEEQGFQLFPAAWIP